MSQGQVITRIDGAVATICFSHPKANSLPSALLESLRDQIVSASAATEIKMIILESEGPGTFCAGANFDELQAAETIADATKVFSGFGKVILAIRDSPKLIITKVQGRVVGGGVGLVAASDYVLALEVADLRLSELSIGLAPLVIAPAIQRKIGVAHFAAAAIDAEWRSAKWAAEVGLYQKIFPSMELLNQGVSLFAERVKGYSPAAISALKSAYWSAGWNAGWNADWNGSEDLAKTMAANAEASAKLYFDSKR